MKSEQYNLLKEKVAVLESFLNGGKGSGNFGHAGRPGQRGGSGKGGLKHSKSGGGDDERKALDKKVREYKKKLKALDEEGVPFTSPRYQGMWEEYMAVVKERDSKKGMKGEKAMVEGVKSYNPEKEIDGGFTVNIKNGKAYIPGESDGYAVGGFGTEKIVDSRDFLDRNKRSQILKDYYKTNRKALSEKGACLGGWVPSSGDLKGKLVLDVSRVFKSEKEAAKWAVKTDQDSITDFRGSKWPTTKDLVKKYGLEKEAEKSKGKRAAERGNA